MASNDNKFSLLASLTSLPGDAETDTLTNTPSTTPVTDDDDDADDDDILPFLAVEQKEPSSSMMEDSKSELFQSAAETVQIQNNLGSSALLSSSGLLHHDSGGGGGGLFDAIDEEEERAVQEAEDQKRFELQEKARIHEELRREKEAADAARVWLQKEEQARREEEKAKTIGEEAKRQQQVQLQQQQQQQQQLQQQQQQQQQQMQSQSQQQASYMNSGSIMGSMQDLNLNDDHSGYISQGGQPQQNGGPLYSNVQNGQHNQYSNVQNTSMSSSQNGNQYSNVSASVNATHANANASAHSQHSVQNSNQYQQQQSQYSNVNGTQPPMHNGGNQYSNVQQQQHPNLVPRPPQSPVRQTTQEAVSGYGGASYVYSTTGNGQVYQQPSGTTNMHASNNMNQNDSSMTSPPPQPNTMPPPAPMPADASQGSYRMRSQTRQAGANIPPMPNQHAPISGSQSYANGGINIGMNGAGSNVQPFVPQYNPAKFRPSFGPISVTDPILVQSPGVFAGPPHWTYAVVVRDVKNIEGQNEFAAVVSNVRRRFRHFVALEERLRADCPGAILSPRPDKHSTRAIDEATARQSAQFAMQRTKELETYLNSLRLHPIAGNSQSLKLFLTLPDHLGIAWPEVSSSIFTRLTEAGTSTAVKVAEGTSAVISELNNENQIMAGEDNSELLALASSEGLRISGVLQSVPKIENTVALIAEQSQRLNSNGMEIQKLVNSVLAHEKEFRAPFEVLASGLLRCGRRTNRLAVELGAAAQAFTSQHKLCRYERLAFSDRRSTLIRRRDARKEADKKAQKLAMNQYSLQSMGNFGKLDGYGRDAAMSNEIAVDAVKESEEIGHILQCEVTRIKQQRRQDWSMSLRVMAANMREAHSERAAIWESCRNALNSSSVEGNWPVSGQHQMHGSFNAGAEQHNVQGSIHQQQPQQQQAGAN